MLWRRRGILSQPASVSMLPPALFSIGYGCWWHRGGTPQHRPAGLNTIGAYGHDLPEAAGRSFFARTARLSVAAMAVIAQALCAQPAARRTAHLDLRERASIQLARGTAVLGGLLAENGAIVYWTPTDVWRVENAHSQPILVCPGLRLAPRSAVRGSLPVLASIFDSLSHSVVDLRSNGACISRQDIRVRAGESLVAGSKTQWVQVVTHRKGPQFIYWHSRQKSRLDSLESTSGVRLGDVADLSARADRDGILVSERRFPFRAYRGIPGGHLSVLLDVSSEVV